MSPTGPWSPGSPSEEPRKLSAFGGVPVEAALITAHLRDEVNAAYDDQEDAAHRQADPDVFMDWEKAIVICLAATDGRFAQLAVPTTLVDALVALLRDRGLTTRVGDSLTDAYRMLTAWRPVQAPEKAVDAVEASEVA